jgi:hypothetical protein
MRQQSPIKQRKPNRKGARGCQPPNPTFVLDNKAPDQGFSYLRLILVPEVGQSAKSTARVRRCKVIKLPILHVENSLRTNHFPQEACLGTRVHHRTPSNSCRESPRPRHKGCRNSSQGMCIHLAGSSGTSSCTILLGSEQRRRQASSPSKLPHTEIRLGRAVFPIERQG